MNRKLTALILFFYAVPQIITAQNITYSAVEKADSRNLSFEILGRFSDNILVYKNIFKQHKITIYNNDMTIKEEVKLDFISERTTNIDFIKYPHSVIMIWQFEKGNSQYCNAAKISEDGKIIKESFTIDTTRAGFLGNKVGYNCTWSEDKKNILLYKYYSKPNVFHLVTKIYNENLLLQDSARQAIEYNDYRESFSDLQITDSATIVFYKSQANARSEYINSIELIFKKQYDLTLVKLELPLEKLLIQEPEIKIDNLNGNFLLNSFSYKKNRGNIDGLFSAIIDSKTLTIKGKKQNIFDDSLQAKLSGKPDWRTAYDNYYLKNIVLKKDGGFVLVSEEYIKQRRFGGIQDDRFNNGFNGGYFGSSSDYYLYNRGYNGSYRSFTDNGRDVVYNYNDIIILGITKDLTAQWVNVINKTTSDVETDNFLSFSNMNAGGQVHFLFLQKDNNRQILSNHALQADGNILRNATLKSGEAGYDFMPRLARQTGSKQMIIPCVVRNNIAFAKIDF